MDNEKSRTYTVYSARDRWALRKCVNIAQRVRACVRACVHACVRACRACVRLVSAGGREKKRRREREIEDTTDEASAELKIEE